MPAMICTCGRETNSSLSNYWKTDGKPTRCFLAVENDVWVEGCAWDEISEKMKPMYVAQLGKSALMK